MSEEKKLIIDEDWKAQVQAERAEAAKEIPLEVGPRAAAPPDFEMPPASWELLLTTLATEAMVSLGLIPHPATGQPVKASTTVAQHPGDIPTGTLRAIERDLEPAFGPNWLRGGTR